VGGRVGAGLGHFFGFSYTASRAPFEVRGERLTVDQIEERARLLREIEVARNARVISLVLGDRRGMETKLAGDILPFVYERLRAIGQTEEIDLFLYTTGGDSLAAWGLVNLIREHCQRFAILVPFRCMSAGTLMALGANEVILTSGAELSPVDPSVSSPYNPPAPGRQEQVNLLPVSVEDLIGFLHLVRNEVGVKDDAALGGVLEHLTEKVHPLALGAVYRAREQVAFLARKLLAFHIDDQIRIDGIVEYFTKSMSHQYLIGRHEARQIMGGEVVPSPADNLVGLILSLYEEYRRFLDLDDGFTPEAEIGAEEGTVVRTYPRAALEVLQNGTLVSRVFRSTRELRSVQVAQPNVNIPVMGVQQRTMAEGWVLWPEGGNNNE
jgi:hypothetical protein